LSAYISVASLRISFFSPPILLLFSMSSITRYAAAEIGKLYVCAFSVTARLNGSEFWRENSAIVLMEPYFYCLMLFKTVKSLLGSSIDKPRLFIQNIMKG
jgi:hypothetical protein